MKSKKSVIGYPIPKDNSYIQRNKFTVLTPEIGVGIDLNKKKNKVSFNQNQPEQSTRAIPHPTELFEDWPTDSEINVNINYNACFVDLRLLQKWHCRAFC